MAHPDSVYKYVHTYTDRHGQTKRYFRRAGCAKVRLSGEPGSSKFLKAYEAAIKAAPPPVASDSRARQLKEAAAVERDVNGRHPKVGVYLLFLDDELVYVGSSLDMPKRAALHRANGRPFDRVFYIGTQLPERIALEKALIRSLHPPQNRASKSKLDQRNSPEWRKVWRERFGLNA